MLPADLAKIMFIDIETVPQTEYFDVLSDEMKHLWEEKFSNLRKRQPDKYDSESSPAEAFENNGGIYAEFGKIICISVGFLYSKDDGWYFRSKSFAGHDEKKILSGFKELTVKFFTSKEHTFCGHNIKEFDIPYICRRMLINGIELPATLNISAKKPWETGFIDTMELWRFGDYKNFTALKLLTAVFGISTPKDDIDGSQVAAVYYKENNIDRISRYCQKDVLATAQVFLRMNHLDIIKDENTEHL